VGLREYRRKRDFKKTLEPAGRVADEPRAQQRVFVVQKHAASRLHYDFRLELEGVLKSWAIPKGPSLDPADKRLAMHVEDHPLEYGDFEGIIPKGQYGGGTVLLWDRGTWQPVGDPYKAYRAGSLKFTLNGEKLHGGFALVRIGARRQSRGDERSWLLIKERDEQAAPSRPRPIVETQPKSVASGRTLEEIAAAEDRVWHSNRNGDRVAASIEVPGARKTALPKFVRPQLATLADRPPTGDRWLHELKHDGERMLARLDHGRAALLSPNAHDWTERFPTVAAAVARLPAEQAILDGEITVLLPDGTSSVRALEELHAGTGRGELTYMIFDLLYLDGRDLTAARLEDRKMALARLLASATDKAAVLRYGDHVVGEGAEFFAHACRLGLTGIVSKRRAAPYSAARSSDWRHVKCRAGKRAVRVGRERLVKADAWAERLSKAEGEAAVAGVRLTHADRILYPPHRTTKLDLARFYEAIADWILPHLKDRPTTLVRCPEGAHKTCFYQKHVGYWAPESVRRVKIQEKRKAGAYLVVDSLASLIGLVQIGILEIHTWNSVVERLEQPDRVVFDLDPGPGVRWTDVIECARLVRDALRALGLESFVKTTGGKGLHVVMPLTPGPSWDETTRFSHAVAESTARANPRRYVARMAKAERQGKIFIDYLRNVRGATSVAAYSTRARPEATVSVPLAWDELSARLASDHFTITNLRARLTTLAVDPWAAYWKTRQTLPKSVPGLTAS
jgi:bifunctional non-homologous end joining protein LigD